MSHTMKLDKSDQVLVALATVWVAIYPVLFFFRLCAARRDQITQSYLREGGSFGSARLGRSSSVGRCGGLAASIV